MQTFAEILLLQRIREQWLLEAHAAINRGARFLMIPR